MLKIDSLKAEINQKPIIDNISFIAECGKVTVITGSNGSGKTSLLSCIMGILPIQNGKIIFLGQDITKLSITERANLGFSIAFQHPTLFKGLTVQNLLEIANPKAQKLDVACAYLSKVGLCARNYLNREFNASLSGGERKRIELALTLAKDAKVNLFDEPESGIDMWSFEELTSIFSDLKLQNKAIIIVSHNKKILEMADKVIIMEHGKIAKECHGKDVDKHINDISCIKLQSKGGENGTFNSTNSTN